MSGIESTDDEGAISLPTLYNLVYCSRAVAGVDAAVVDSIIAVARRRNPVNGITGLLVFGSGIFFQWLEGPRDRVTQLMTNIKRDTRHDTVVPLSESEEVRERMFPDWDMELVTTDEIRAVLEDAMDNAEDEKNVKALRRLLGQLDDGELSGLGTG
jgi:hypothetical protein